MQAASHLNADYPFKTEFPQDGFGNSIKTACQIVANEARNRVRSSGRRHQLDLRLTEGFRPGDAVPSPEAVAVALDERRRLLELVNSLGEDDRMVIASRYFLELSGEETAAALGIPEGTVKSRLSRALARLRARVEEAASA